MAPANAVAAAARKPSSDVEATVPSTQCFGVWRAERQRIAVMDQCDCARAAERRTVVRVVAGADAGSCGS